jgi:hypothetical protein
MKRNEILLKPKVLDWEKLCSIPWTFVKFQEPICAQICSVLSIISTILNFEQVFNDYLW